MLKNILKLDGALELTKNELKSINGGLACEVGMNWYCPTGSVCCRTQRWLSEDGTTGMCRQIAWGCN